MALFSKGDWYNPAPFWENGPAPGSFYHFPGEPAQVASSGRQHSQSPMTTGTSVVGIQFKDGVVIAADTLGSFGSLARFRSCERIMKVNDNVILGSTGDYADYQCIKRKIERKILEEDCLDDGFSIKPKALYCWLTRIMYNSRSKFDPFWNNFVIAGLDDDGPFLGTIDKLGTAYADPVVATGYGGYMATPLLRAAQEKHKDMTEKEAVDFLYQSLQVLFYRDARSFPKYHLGIVTKDRGVEIRGPLTLDSKWEAA